MNDIAEENSSMESPASDAKVESLKIIVYSTRSNCQLTYTFYILYVVAIENIIV